MVEENTFHRNIGPAPKEQRPPADVQEAPLSAPISNESLPVDVKDARDEDDEDSFDDPYTYSDDSASLSDAYFLPQSDDELARPPRFREDDTLRPAHTFPMASYYGAITAQDRAISPLWVSGPIQEDAESLPPIGNEEFANLVTADPRLNGLRRKEKKKQKRQQLDIQRMRMKQRERERAVTMVRGQPQDMSTWKDPIFAVVFILQLLVIVFFWLRFSLAVGKGQGFNAWRDFINSKQSYWQLQYAIKGNLNALHEDTVSTLSPWPVDDSFYIDFKNIIALVSISGFYACFLTFFSFGLMLVLARALIQIMLVLSVLLAIVWGTIGVTLDPYGVISIMGFTALLLTLGYTMYNWSRIPFAGTNLYTALCAMRCTADISLLGLAGLFVAFSWCAIWTIAVMGITVSLGKMECNSDGDCQQHVKMRHIPIYLLLLFSFHWTNTVITNIVRVTVASAIGTWWFAPEEIGPICTKAVTRPLLRSFTKSLGSICKGSLLLLPAYLVGAWGRCCCCLCHFPDRSCLNSGHSIIVAPMRKQSPLPTTAVTSPKQSGRTGCCGGFLSCLEGFRLRLRATNRWSFTYIGMYGYDFSEGGRRALELFETREWLEVVRDNLITNVITMASIIIGGSTGTFAVVVEETDGYDFTSFHKPVVFAFIIGAVIGFVVSNVLLLGVVGSAVNTVLVCFAAGPFEFDKNHPLLSREMRDVWSQQVWEPSV